MIQETILDDNGNEHIQYEYINVSQFIRDLPLSVENKKMLLLCIASIQKETGETIARSTVAACMGLSEDDPKFNAFYNNDIAPIINLDVQKMYEQLVSLIVE